MRRSVFCVFAAGFFIALAGSNARAQCIEDPRVVRLDQKNSTRLKSYLCSDGQIKVEKFRLSDEVTSLIVQRNSSGFLEKILGSPKIVENEIFKNYADLTQKFGHDIVVDGSREVNHFGVKTGGREIFRSDHELLKGTNFKVLQLDSKISGWYPAVEEIESLRKKAVPNNLNYYYSSHCLDTHRPASDEACGELHISTVFWREMRSDDIENYSRRVDSYNALVKRLTKEAKDNSDPEHFTASTAISDELKLLKYLVGEKSPDHFAIIHGVDPKDIFHSGDGKDISPYMWLLRGFKYEFLIGSEWLLIENSSTRDLKLGGITGKRFAEMRLRPASRLRPNETDLISNFSETLAPGQRLLVPLRILLTPVIDETTEPPGPTRSAEIRSQRRGAIRYGGSVGRYVVPDFGEYVYGAELFVSGMVVDGKRVVLSENSVNEISFSFSSPAGHCPYLFSWNKKDGAWVEHGKVLHKGEGRPREYSETKSFEGFQARFRLEERELELAHIDQAELAIALKDGGTLVLKPDQAKLTRRDGDYAKLYWGDAIEFSFALPAGVAAADVVESRLTLTGYYERYANLLAENRASGLQLAPQAAAGEPAAIP